MPGHSTCLAAPQCRSNQGPLQHSASGINVAESRCWAGPAGGGVTPKRGASLEPKWLRMVPGFCLFDELMTASSNGSLQSSHEPGMMSARRFCSFFRASTSLARSIAAVDALPVAFDGNKDGSEDGNMSYLTRSMHKSEPLVLCTRRQGSKDRDYGPDRQVPSASRMLIRAR